MRILRGSLIALTGLLIVIGGSVIGMRLSSTVMEETEIGRVAVQISPSFSGDVEAFIPLANWGVRVDAFNAPLRVRAELRSLNRQALLRLTEGDRALIKATENQLKDAGRSAVIRAVIWSAATVLILLLIATVLWRGLTPRWTLPAVGVLLLLVIYGGTALWAKESFDRTAFNHPTYFAQGKEIARILDLVDDPRFQSGYGSEFTSIVRSIGAVLTDESHAAPNLTEVYSGSDLHINALVIDPVARLVGKDTLFMVGDFGQRGNEAESALLAPRVAALGSRVVAVSGNHDSHTLMNRLAQFGVTVLGQEGRLDDRGNYEPPPVIPVDGLQVAGFRDPLEYGGNSPDTADRPITANDFPDPEVEIEKWQVQLLDWFNGLPTQPNVVMVHQTGLAQWLAAELHRSGYRRPLTILTGHDHQQHIDRYGPVVVVDAGTIGASGIFGAGSDSVGIARLRFIPKSRDEPARLSAVDLIAVEPFSGAARATRVIIDRMCPDEDTCRIEPDQSRPEPGE